MRKLKLGLVGVSACLLLGSLVGCNNEPPKKKTDGYSFTVATESSSDILRVGSTDTIVVSEYFPEGAEPVSYTFDFESSDASVLKVTPSADKKSATVEAVGDGEAYVYVAENVNGLERQLDFQTFSKDPLTGAASYRDADVETKAEILGKLEKYAMDHHLTGISLFENGGYVMYNPRVQKGTETYITGYGFGILGEGDITSDLASEENPAWKRYYHSATSTDQKSVAYLNSDNSGVSDLASYFTTGVFGTKMNSTKDGYEWYGILAKENRPVAVKLDSATGKYVESGAKNSAAWKVKVKTGADGLKYATNSTKVIGDVDMSSFNGRDVALEDYVYAFKMLLTGNFGLFRGNEMASATSGGIKGAKEYYKATEKTVGTSDELFAKNVGVYADKSDNSIVIVGTETQTSFLAMYQLFSSNLHQPIPKDFILALGEGNESKGVENYGNFIESNGATPVDTSLSLGVYTLESWEKDKAIVFKKNNLWIENVPGNPLYSPNRNRIPGVKVTVYPGATTDNTLIIKEFEKGNLDAAGLPTAEYIRKYRDDPRTTTTEGDSVFKLNINACTQEQWEENFGINGKFAKTDKSNYWDVKPWMSNDSFLKGLNTSIDRLTFADNRGVIPSNNYFSSNYLIDPENGVSYNDTEAHQKAKADYFPETYGYNLAASKGYFKRAVEELVENGDLELGTVEKPTKISIEIWWMYENDIKDYGDEISKYFKDAFNDPSVSGGRVVLDIVNKGVATWTDVYYKHLMVGQFDLGFGSISGNSLDPINFMEVLKSDNSSGFTLNWGDDTSVVAEDLIFDGRQWSFDGLWSAADTYAYAKNGVLSPLFTLTAAANLVRGEDGSLSITLIYDACTEEGIVATPYYTCLFATNDPDGYSDYNEIYVYMDGSDDLKTGKSSFVVGTIDIEGVTYTCVTITFAPEIVEAFVAYYGQEPTIIGVDLYYYYQVFDIAENVAFVGTVNLPSIPVVPNP